MKALLIRFAVVTALISLAGFSGMSFYGIGFLQIVALILVNMFAILLCIHFFMQLTLVKDQEVIAVRKRTSRFPAKD